VPCLIWSPSNINGDNLNNISNINGDNLNNIKIEQHEYLTNLYMMFVDFEKHFYSISRNKIWEIMNRYGMP
jgi:hypothetical protein